MSFHFHRFPRFSRWSNSDFCQYFVKDKTKKKFYTLGEVKERLHRKMHWLEIFLDKAQNVITFPQDFWYSIHVYCRNVKTSSHVLDGGLEKGVWYDLVERIPLCLFSELESFVEEEKGLDVHKWEMGLVCDENNFTYPEDNCYGAPTGQALAAMEQDVIYKWWKANKDRDFYAEAGEEYGKMTQLEEEYVKQETEMLKRLIDSRGSLWT